MEQSVNRDETQQQPLGTADAAAKIEEVFQAFGSAVLQIQKEQEAIRETLTLIITERTQFFGLVEGLAAQVTRVFDMQDKSSEAVKAFGRLLEAMDARLRLLTTFADLHHDLFVKHGWANPRPKADPLAN
jgi:hypothetical protein